MIKTFPLEFDSKLHSIIKKAADSRNISIKKYIIDAIIDKLEIDEYLELDDELREKVKNVKDLSYIKVKSFSDLIPE